MEHSDRRNGNLADSAEAAPDAVYVNLCTVTADLSDARLDFGQTAGDGSPPRIKARLITSPVHLLRFRDVISDACREHEARFPDQSETGSR